MLPDDLDAQLVKASAQALRYTPGKLACFSEWSKQVQARLRELLRADLWPTSALKISVLSREDGDGFMREKIDFSGHPLFSGSAYVLVPNHRKGRVPGVLCLHGHGGYFAGKDMVAGVTGTHPIALECAAALNYGYGVQLARAGYVTLCPDAYNFGERLFEKHRWSKEHICSEYFANLMLYGYSSMGITVGTNILLLDYLLTRPEVLPDQAGCAGLSYGAVQTLFTAAVDDRIQASVVSGGLHSMGELVAAGGSICPAQMLPGLLEWFDLDDVAISIAPRPALYELMKQDSCFDFESSRRIWQKISGVYGALMAADRTCLDAPDTDHRYSGAHVPAFLKLHLGLR